MFVYPNLATFSFGSVACGLYVTVALVSLGWWLLSAVCCFDTLKHYKHLFGY